MVYMLGIIGIIVGAGFGDVWGAAIFGLAGAMLGHWITRSEAARQKTVAERAAAEPPGNLRAELQALKVRVARLEAGLPKSHAESAAAVQAPPFEAPAPAAEW